MASLKFLPTKQTFPAALASHTLLTAMALTGTVGHSQEKEGQLLWSS